MACRTVRELTLAVTQRRPLHKPARPGLSGFFSGAFESPTLVYPNVLIGDRADAMDLGFLLRCGVTHVLNTTKQLRPCHESKFIYLQVS